ncbi:MAG: hypothetical protein AAFN12_16445 [Cyanobacteria bacterium J06560_2]
MLSLADVKMPVLQSDELLVRVQAAALHVGDCSLMLGRSLLPVV